VVTISVVVVVALAVVLVVAFVVVAVVATGLALVAVVPGAAVVLVGSAVVAVVEELSTVPPDLVSLSDPQAPSTTTAAMTRIAVRFMPLAIGLSRTEQ
jgi:hypothetical protein